MHPVIESTPTYQSLENFQKRLVLKRTNRLKLEQAVIVARNIGIEKWKEQSGLPSNYNKIVEDIIKQNNHDTSSTKQ